MKRREFCFLSGASLFSALATSCQKIPIKSFSTSSSRPNVLFISIDDLNDWVGVLDGHPQAKTPNLDRLANQGILFNKAYCSAPACNPSRTAILTGIEPYHSGLYGNKLEFRQLLPNAVTIPQLFQRNGYRVKGAGKIYHSNVVDGFQREGWDEFYLRKREGIAFSAIPRPENRPVNGLPNTGYFDWGAIPNPAEDMYDFDTASWVIDQLNNQDGDQPFFLAFGLSNPHIPWYLPRQYFAEFPLEEIQLPKIKIDDLNDIPPVGIQKTQSQGYFILNK